MQNYAIFCYFKHEIQLFKVLLTLKVVKFDKKMYLNFSNFRERTSPGGGGDKSWSKNGDKCRMGGDWQNFRQMGGPPSPPGKKPWLQATQLGDRRVANGIARCILLRTFIYALLVYLGAVAQKSAKLCWKCKQRPKLRLVKFHFCSVFSRKWRCIFYLTLYKDVYQLFVRHSLILS